VGLLDRLPIPKPTGAQLLISVLIAGIGWYSGQTLSQVDQDLRIMYTEYTLGATDLAHISADTMRYRNTIIRALEADSEKSFERITESLPVQRAKIQHAIDRYAAAGLRVSRSGRSEPEDIESVRRSLDQYFSAASTTVQLLTRNGQPTPGRARSLASESRRACLRQCGPKIQVSLASTIGIPSPCGGIYAMRHKDSGQQHDISEWEFLYCVAQPIPGPTRKPVDATTAAADDLRRHDRPRACRRTIPLRPSRDPLSRRTPDCPKKFSPFVGREFFRFPLPIRNQCA
jgi:hypothetical protein